MEVDLSSNNNADGENSDKGLCRYPLRGRMQLNNRAFGANITNLVSCASSGASVIAAKRGKRKSSALELDDDGPPKKRQRNSYNLRSRSNTKDAMQIDDNNSNNNNNNSDEDSLECIREEISIDEQPSISKSKHKTDEVAKWDIADVDNDLSCVAYVGDIMTRLKEAECEFSVGDQNDYMTRQSDINSRMRTILLDWLVEVHRKFQLTAATFFLTINLLDRYLSEVDVHRSELQLTGCACMWLASKYHEIYAPEMDDFVFISDGAFTQRDLINVESKVAATLKFALTVPTPLSFADRFIKIGIYDQTSKGSNVIGALSHYLIEHCVMDYDLARKKPSKIAAACVAYALLGTKLRSQWPACMVEETGYDIESMWDVIKRLDAIVKTAKDKCKHKAVRKKYSHSSKHRVALLEFKKVQIYTFISKDATDDDNND